MRGELADFGDRFDPGADGPADGGQDQAEGEHRHRPPQGEVDEETERARRLGAQLLNAQPAEIALTTGNSAGWGAAFAALGGWRSGERILVGRHEWGGNLSAMRMAAQRDGVSIEVIPCDASGAADAQALEAMLDERVRIDEIHPSSNQHSMQRRIKTTDEPMKRIDLSTDK